jgi:hypothetical protein
MLVKIMETLDVDYNEFKFLLKDLWDAWLAHPYFDEYYESDSAGWAPKDNLINPLCMGVYSHEEGLRGDTSYIISSLSQVVRLACKEKVSKMLGKFQGVQPIWPDLRLSWHIKYRWAMISNSPLGSGNGYECRELLLKQLLPKKLHRAIRMARKQNRAPKWHYLPNVLDDLGQDPVLMDIHAMARDRSLQPDEYRGTAKGRLFIKYTLTEAERYWLSFYFEDLYDFWRIANGSIKSIEARDLIKSERANQQLVFPGWEM